MRIVTLLPQAHLASLADVIGELHDVHSATDPLALLSLLRCVDADLFVFDPAINDGAFSDAIEAIVVAFRQLPFIVYTTVSARSMALVLRLAPVGLRHMVLVGIDDEPCAFRELIERVPSFPLIDLMLAELSGSLSLLPSAAQRGVELLYRMPSRVRSGADLADVAGMTRRTLYRHMATAGLQPRLLIDSARLLRAFTLLRAPGSRLKEVSARLGFSNPETLSQLLREWTGHTVRSIHGGVEPAIFVRFLANNVLRSTLNLEEVDSSREAIVEAV